MRTLMRMTAACCAVALAMTGLPADDKKPAPKPVTDEEFVIKAASSGMFEIESSKLAKDAAASADVKKFAEKMIADHEKADKELKAAAAKVNVGLPVKMLDHHQKMLDAVKAAKGAGFDKAYVEAQVKGHDEAVMLFSGASKSVKDAGLKEFATKTLPTLEHHQEMAKKLHNSTGGK